MRSQRARSCFAHGRRTARQRAGDSSGDTLADITWRAGVDALSFGFVKNGGLNAEALILFRTELGDEIAVRRKRAGHLLSKGRYLAAQILAMLEDDLGSTMRAPRTPRRDRSRRRRRSGCVYPVEANEIFLKVTRGRGGAAARPGFDFYDWGPGEIRLVTSWNQKGEGIEKLASAIAAL